MMSPVRAVLSMFVVALRRLWSTRWLALAGALGFVAAIATAFSVPMYADAVYHRILGQQLGIGAAEGVRLPPFAFMFRYNLNNPQGTPGGVWEGVQAADRYLDAEAPSRLDMPRTAFVRYYQTTNLSLYRASDSGSNAKPLTNVPLTALSDFGAHVNLLEGQLPGGESGDAIGVLVSKAWADKLGAQVGDRYVAETAQLKPVRIPVVVSGVWEPRDLYDTYWFYRPDLLEPMLIAAEQPFTQRAAPALDKSLAEVLWYMDFDGRGVRVWNVPDLLDRIRALMVRADTQQLGISLSASPEGGLQGYQRDSQALTVQLYTFSIPLFVLVLTFIILVASLTVNGQRNEIAVLRSRGASAWQVFGISLLEAGALATGALAIGAPVALGIAALVGQARSFMRFTGGEWLPVAVTPANLPFGIAGAVVAVVLTVVPVIEASRHTIITYKAERARTLRPPAWQRAWLDVLLLIPTGYWTYLLQKQGSVDIPGIGITGNDPFSNPSLFIMPALALFALSLFLIRILPLLIRLLAWLVGRLPGTALLLATRQLARSPGLYSAPMLLLVLTLALATFTASVAASLDQHLVERTRYDVGADVKLVNTGQNIAPVAFANWNGTGEASSQTSSGSTGTTGEEETARQERWSFLPIGDYYKADGVQSATRVGNYAGTLQFGGGSNLTGLFMGVDRTDFARVAYWRNDFAAQPLGALMNDLATSPDAVLVPEMLLKQNALTVGDPLRVTVILPDISVDLTLKIAGTFKLWPSWYMNKEESRVLVVGNLDYLFDVAGGQASYDVWIKTKRGADPAAVAAVVRKVDKNVLDYRNVRSLIDQEQLRPERQGLFGMLSIGFGAAALLTVAGFMLYAIFSLQRRFIELGVLRAMGLSTRQMALALGCELALLLGTGILAGTALGITASRLYIPYLQVSATDPTRTLPLAVVLDWPAIYGIYAVFGLLFVAAVAGLLAFMRRLQIFQAVKLGEAE
jgi:putative ABC transport system permease protein